jgi:hypothetical protein
MPQLAYPNVTLVKGTFEETVPQFLAAWRGSAAIVHIDCTLYNSTMACLPHVLPRCQKGTILIFDEYYNYSDFTQHEWRAWRELRDSYKITAPCIGYDSRRVAFQFADLGKLAKSEGMRQDDTPVADRVESTPALGLRSERERRSGI